MLKRKFHILTLILLTLSCLLAFFVLAEPLDVDNDAPRWNDVSASAVIDDLWYEREEPGVAYLSGHFNLLNLDFNRSINYFGEFRLAILGYAFDEKIPFSGRVPSHAHNTDSYFTMSKTLALHVDRTNAERDRRHTMLGSVTLNVPTRGNLVDSWQAIYSKEFTHRPLSLHGIGPTKNEDTFSTDFYGNAGDTWKSLLITDAPYEEVLWYVQGPGDTSPHGAYIEVDSPGAGESTKATMSYRFPENVDGQYRIWAEIWRNDGSNYWLYYTVHVSD